MSGLSDTTDRLVLFEIGGAAYALPIAEVVEVSEPGAPAGVPSLPRRVASVMNLHGDALLVVSRRVLFDTPERGFAEPSHVLVIGADALASARLGLPVDRVLGIVPGRPPQPGGTGLVAERRELEGRVVGLLDVRRLIQQASRSIESVNGSEGTSQGGKE